MSLNKEVKKEVKPNMKYMRDKDHEMVKGIFRYNEVPGAMFSFSFRKYKEDKITRYDLMDGQVYTIPLMVAKHLVNDCWYPVHEYTKLEESGLAMKIGSKVHRTNFQSLEFVDVEELTQKKELITTEYVGL